MVALFPRPMILIAMPPRGTDPLQPRSLLLTIVSLIAAVAMLDTPRSFAAEPSDVPDWLRAYVGEGEGQIAPVVLQRARALYLQKANAGTAKNPVTSPWTLRAQAFQAIPYRAPVLRDLRGGAVVPRDLVGLRRRPRSQGKNFANGRQCAKHFSNAMGSMLTTGGSLYDGRGDHVFQRLLSPLAGREMTLIRSFVQFDGERDTANARQREIGGHAAILLRGVCRRKKPDSPYADQEGYVPYGTVENYIDGRSSGCTSWSASDA